MPKTKAKYFQYPFPLGEVTGFAGAYPGKIIDEMDWSDDLKKKLLSKNAENFLGL